MSAPAQTPAAAPVAGTTQPQQGVTIDQADITSWTNRFDEALKNHTVITAPAAHDARPWSESLFGCFAPIDLCAITCCCPCVTFGKTHHRIRKNNTMEGYSAVNASCLMFSGFACFGLAFIPVWMQRVDIRKKYNLQGNLVTDLLTTCCCGCCAMIQEEKESELHERELLNKVGYAKQEQMSFQA